MLDQEPLIDEVIDVAAHKSGVVTRCRLRLFPGADGAPVVVVTALPENTGFSVTNAAESVWRAIARRLDTVQFTLVEHYDERSFHGATESFKLVTVTDGQPHWQDLDADGLRRLVKLSDFGPPSFDPESGA